MSKPTSLYIVIAYAYPPLCVCTSVTYHLSDTSPRPYLRKQDVCQWLLPEYRTDYVISAFSAHIVVSLTGTFLLTARTRYDAN